MIPSNLEDLKRWGSALLTLTLLVGVSWLVYRQLQNLDWAEVMTTLARYNISSVLIALAAAIVGYIVVSCYDLIGRHYTDHSLPVLRVLRTSYIGYTFSLNFGALVGGVGFRYRLYLKAGLSTQTATKIIGLSILANWSGYVLLAGLLFAFAPPQLPESWFVEPLLLRIIGVVLLIASIAYVWLCSLHAGKSWKVRGFDLFVPSLELVAIQFSLSIISWCAISTIIYVLMPPEINWYLVLAAMLTSSIAAVISHIPGGIGVIELVFISLLGHLAAESSIVAALLVFRFLYYLLPLILALILYAVIEIKHRRN